MTEQATRRAYRAPALVVHGSLEAITHGASSGSRLDAAFGRNTPVSQLTFS